MSERPAIALGSKTLAFLAKSTLASALAISTTGFSMMDQTCLCFPAAKTHLAFHPCSHLDTSIPSLMSIPSPAVPQNTNLGADNRFPPGDFWHYSTSLSLTYLPSRALSLSPNLAFFIIYILHVVLHDQRKFQQLRNRFSHRHPNVLDFLWPVCRSGKRNLTTIFQSMWTFYYHFNSSVRHNQAT